MTHNHERSDWKTEMMLTSITGVLYGGTNTIVGHPLDTIKTKMQAQPGFVDHGGLKESIK
jgi:solute carrier family 25 carnitine/acylcarnitine transporter 20/29